MEKHRSRYRGYIIRALFCKNKNKNKNRTGQSLPLTRWQKEYNPGQVQYFAVING
jgi:hypothetical protein